MESGTITQIANLRICSTDRDSPALRLAVTRQLSGFDMNPSGLPPSSVFIVRKLTDPLPGRIRSDVRGAGFDPMWENALLEKLERLSRNAQRPSKGLFFGKPDAVLFNDEAELLACLLIDLTNGRAHQCWWWHSFLKNQWRDVDRSGQVCKFLEDKPHTIPSVLTLLTNWRQALSVISSLSPEHSSQITTSMLNAFGLRDFAERLSRLTYNEQPFGKSVVKKTAPDGGNPAGQLISDDTGYFRASDPHFSASFFQEPLLSPPWEKLLDHWSIPTGLNNKQAALLGLALMLYTRPQALRHPGFQLAMLSWQKVSFSEEISLDARNRLSEKRYQEIPGQEDQPGPELIFPQLKSTDLAGGIRQEGKGDQKTDISGMEDITAKQPITISAPSVQLNSQKSVPITEIHFPEKKLKRTSDENSRSFESKETSSKIFWPDNGTPTRLGGILYLINLMDRLDIPGIFESHWALDSGLSRWALLECLARALLDKYICHYKDDPIWALLADLDGRDPGDAIGRSVTDTGIYRLPTEWLKTMDLKEHTCLWATSCNCLRIWYGSGFLLVEVPCRQGNPVDQAIHELRAYFPLASDNRLTRAPFGKAPIGCCKRLTAQGIHVDLSQWLSLVIPALGKIIQMFLKLPSSTSHTLAKNLFTCPGQFHVTTTHIDFVTDINNIFISIRAAGLDRNPGWLPEWGRVVKFHFL
ncbi:hypothetical protein [uncultured Desulfobacter sp.]|uniref:hypothetical protein n=1 Tax=uncultured Desulfobacter sp. TaxID=240139 RepID=UPI0029F5289F|nr:hypothetical protein [uncultured Desulfobacter sp.]